MEEQYHGLTAEQVHQARLRFGENSLPLHRASLVKIILRQFNNPLLLILVVTTVVAYFLGDHVNAAIILGILFISIVLGFCNEYASERVVSDLLRQVSLMAVVMREGRKQDVRVQDLVMGDFVYLQQGSVVPADMELLEVHNLSIDESPLTGESMPVNKQVGEKAYMGTVVEAGAGIGLVRAVGKATEFGRLAHEVTQTREQTAFQKGLTRFGKMLTTVITVMAVAIGLLNIGLGKPVLDSILFALAIAIGLTPALLPVIVTVSMAQGARRMAQRNVVVKELVSIEDFGNMDVLCTDKTGTLTEGRIAVQSVMNMRGEADLYILECGIICNTAEVHHRIVGNPIDVALWQYAQTHHANLKRSLHKIDGSEFSFEQRGQYVIVDRPSQWPANLDEDSHLTKAQHATTRTIERLIIFKGAPDKVMDRSAFYRDSKGELVEIGKNRERLEAECKALNRQGFRLIAVAQKPVEHKDTYSFDDAQGLELLGYITFLDTPKHSSSRAIAHLNELGIQVKVVTGDNELVTAKVCEEIGFPVTGLLTGPAISHMSFRDLKAAVKETNIFARVSPEQKQLIVKALKATGRTVGYLGDGINDAPALHAADVAISVNTGVDLAKDLASVVLLRKGLDVIAEGVREGRRIFANTIKYILMGTSSNFGNMFSVAGISFFINFLPMTPSQILVNNSLYDISQLGLPMDNVDEEVLERPSHWDVRFIYRYMLFFGPISSIFDYLSFAMLWFVFHATVEQFQSGWFLESLATQVLVVFIIRTWRTPAWKSVPSRSLVTTCFVALGVGFLLPYSPVASFLHFQPLPAPVLAAVIGLVVGYLAVVEAVKVRYIKPLVLKSK
jgi:Mg2+-importing ATPase